VKTSSSVVGIASKLRVVAMNAKTVASGLMTHGYGIGGASSAAVNVDIVFIFHGVLLSNAQIAQEFGHPMLRARHFPFAIGESERDQWMLCMNKAIAETPMDSRLETNLKNALQELATHMINQE
jgi:hypothetical protein